MRFLTRVAFWNKKGTPVDLLRVILSKFEEYPTGSHTQQVRRTLSLRGPKALEEEVVFRISYAKP